VSPLIKICGVTGADNAAGVAAAGVDFIGLNFWAPSKRSITLLQSMDIAAAIRHANHNVKLVGVFVDQPLSEIVEFAKQVRLDVIQLHGIENKQQIIAVRDATGCAVWKVAYPEHVAHLVADADAVVLDTPSQNRGGSGQTFDWRKTAKFKQTTVCRLVLAGGLNASNVVEAITVLSPWCVDTASGVESSPGVKDLTSVRAFVSAVRSAPSL
jgi:phosphoribosylanthranilate isomerase